MWGGEGVRDRERQRESFCVNNHRGKKRKCKKTDEENHRPERTGADGCLVAPLMRVTDLMR